MKEMKVLRLTNVSKTYNRCTEVIKNINFTVSKGDFFALLGPNGAGKSTILGIVSSLINKTNGKITICGFDADKQSYFARQMLGVMPQEINLSIFETPMQILLTQAGYFGIPRKKSEAYIKRLLNDVNLLDKCHVQIRFLSGGMKRLVMVLRALVHKPKLLILDEPTAGIDVQLRHTFWEIISKLNKKGLTIILTTHYLEEAERMCNRIALINNGMIHSVTDMSCLLQTLETEIYILDLKSPINSKNLLFDFGHVRVINNLRIEITVSKLVTLTDLFLLLNKNDITVLSIRSKANRLERLFLDIVRTKIKEK